MSLSSRTRGINCALFSLVASLAVWSTPASAQKGNPSTVADIGSNGTPTLIGNLGGSIAGNSAQFSDLQVTINFGEVSPLNASRVVTAIVPISIRSTRDFALTATVSNFINNGDPNGLQLSDIGFGIQNLAPTGGNAKICPVPSAIAAPFNNDPSLTVNVSDRASYQSSLANVTTSTLVVSGPRLSQGALPDPKNSGAWTFNAIFTIVPQFYTSGTASVTVTFNIALLSTDSCK